MTEFSNATTICAGRLVAGLPATADVKISATFKYIETKSVIPAEDFQSISDAMVQRKDEYEKVAMHRDKRSDDLERAAGYDPDKTYGKTKFVGYRNDGLNKQIAIGYHPDITDSNTVSEVYKFANGLKYMFSSTGFGADSYARVSSTMWDAVLNFQPVNRGDVPATPGFCVDGGMFSDPGSAPLREGFTLVASFKNHPDANFVIDSSAIDSIDTNEPSLKHRVDSELGILRANVEGRVSVLIRGEREAAGQKGYQIGLSVPNDSIEGTTAYKFFWAADGVPNDASRPFMEVSLTIQPDEDKPASFENAKQAQAFWDELLQRIKIRPGAVGGSPTR